jgi:hypothetical protein
VPTLRIECGDAALRAKSSRPTEFAGTHKTSELIAICRVFGLLNLPPPVKKINLSSFWHCKCKWSGRV